MWVPGYGLNIHQISWILFFERPNSIIPCTCSSNLKYSIKFNETKKLTKYSKKSQNCPKFQYGVLNNVGRPHKKWVKKPKKKYFAECRPWHSAKRSFAECQEVALGKEGIFTECRALALGKEFFKKNFDGVGGQVPFFFAKCHSLPSVALGKEGFCRVPDTLWHSAKPLFAKC